MQYMYAARWCLFSLKQVQLATRLQLLKRKDDEYQKNTIDRLDAML